MKILWLINTIMPAQAQKYNLPGTSMGGWINGMLEALRDKNIEISICAVSRGVQETQFFSEEEIGYYTVPWEENLTPAFKSLLEEYKPDLVHIFGTEYAHTLAMQKAADPSRTLVQIQGLVSACGEKYFEGLPVKCQAPGFARKRAAKKLGGMLMVQEQAIFLESGQRELESLSLAQHVLGHTSWDCAQSARLAPMAQYHSFPEVLRKSFYTGKWNYDDCEKHTVLISQAGYPIKGFHQFIKALPELAKKYPDIHVYVGGDVPPHDTPARRKTYEYIFDYYGYLMEELRRTNMEKHVTFTGILTEEKMKERFLKSHVFASCSSIENESNSLSEAKLLGVPSVSSYVGGVVDRIQHGKDGFFYPFAEPDMLGYYIGRIFDDHQLAMQLSDNSYENSHKLNDPEVCSKALVDIYHSVVAR